MAQDQAHHSHPAPFGPETSRVSSDEGENEEREEATEKLDCHYSGYHPRPAAVSTRNLVILPCEVCLRVFSQVPALESHFRLFSAFELQNYSISDLNEYPGPHLNLF